MEEEVDQIKAELNGFDIRTKVTDELKSLRQNIQAGLKSQKFLEASAEALELPKFSEFEGALVQCLRDAMDLKRAADIWTCVDDRMLGRYKKVGNSRIVGTIDLLEFFEQRGAISRLERLNILHRLRAGYTRYLSASEDEILDLLRQAQIQNCTVVETVELTTIRKYYAGCIEDQASLQRVQAPYTRAKVLSELSFLMRHYTVVLDSIRMVWTDPDLSDERQIAFSDWLLESLWFDFAGLPELVTEFQGADGLVSRGLQQVFMIGFQLPSFYEEGGKAKQYWHWLFSRIGTEPKRWSPVLESAKNGLIEIARDSVSDDKLYTIRATLNCLAKATPQLLRSALTLNTEETSLLRTDAPVTFTLGPLTFLGDELWECCKKALDGGAPIIKAYGTGSQRFKVSMMNAQQCAPTSIHFASLSCDQRFIWSDAMICLLHRDAESRKTGLFRTRTSLDLSVEEARTSFGTILKENDPGNRINAYISLANGAFSEHLRTIEKHLKVDRQIDLEILRPKDVPIILRHLRLTEKLNDPSLSNELARSAQLLLDEEGVREAFIRFSSLPFPIPGCIRSAYSSMEAEERGELVTTFEGMESNPLLAMHVASLLLEGSPQEQGKGLELISHISKMESFGLLEYFGHVLRWAFSCLCHEHDNEIETLAYVIAAWIYTGRLIQISGPPSDMEGMGSFFKSNTPTASKFTFCPKTILGDSRIHPTWFDPAALQLGSISRLLPNKPLDSSMAKKIGQNLRPLCFPIPNLGDQPAFQVYQMDGHYSQPTGSYFEPEYLSNLAELPGLEKLAEAIDPNRGKELTGLIKHLRNHPSDSDSWILLVAITGKSVFQPEHVNLLVDAIAKIRFRDSEDSPTHVFGIAVAVFEMAQRTEFREAAIDWNVLLESFGKTVLSRNFCSEPKRSMEACLNAAYCVGVSPERSEGKNIQGFVDSIRSLLIEAGCVFR